MNVNFEREKVALEKGYYALILLNIYPGTKYVSEGTKKREEFCTRLWRFQKKAGHLQLFLVGIFYLRDILVSGKK